MNTSQPNEWLRLLFAQQPIYRVLTKQSLRKKLSVNAEKPVLFIGSSDDLSVKTKEGELFVMRLIAAIGQIPGVVISKNDIYFLPSDQLEGYYHYDIGNKHTIIFGSSPLQHFPDLQRYILDFYRVFTYVKTSILLSDKLNELIENQEKKRQLWKALQQLFQQR